MTDDELKLLEAQLLDEWLDAGRTGAPCDPAALAERIPAERRAEFVRVCRVTGAYRRLMVPGGAKDAELAALRLEREQLVTVNGELCAEVDKLRAELANDSWTGEMQQAIEAIPREFLGNDFWVNGIVRMGAALSDLRLELEGLKKANALLNAGMGDVCEGRDVLKMEVRELKAENERLKAMISAFVLHIEKPDVLVGELRKTAEAWVAERDRLRQLAGELRGALQVLSCLGNGDKPGNSIGNRIAQDALARCDAELPPQTAPGEGGQQA